MAVARLTVSRPAIAEAASQNLSDEVELYQRTYTTLLRSSGETRLRVLEPSHRAMGSSAAPAGRQRRARPRRLPLRDPPPARRRSPRATIVVMGQEAALFARAGHRPARGLGRRRGARRGAGAGTTAATSMLAVLLASESDVDDLVPTLVAYQIEWNKIRRRWWPPAGRRSDGGSTPEACAAALGGARRRLGAPARGWGAPSRSACGDRGSGNVDARAHARRHPGRLRSA